MTRPPLMNSRVHTLICLLFVAVALTIIMMMAIRVWPIME